MKKRIDMIMLAFVMFSLGALGAILFPSTIVTIHFVLFIVVVICFVISALENKQKN